MLTQKQPSTQFFLGFLAGIVMEIFFSVVASWLLQVGLITLYGADSINANMVGGISLAVAFGVLIGSVVIAQTIFKSKPFSVGIVVGWLTLPIVFAIVAFTAMTLLN